MRWFEHHVIGRVPMLDVAAPLHAAVEGVGLCGGRGYNIAAAGLRNARAAVAAPPLLLDACSTMVRLVPAAMALAVANQWPSRGLDSGHQHGDLVVGARQLRGICLAGALWEKTRV